MPGPRQRIVYAYPPHDFRLAKLEVSLILSKGRHLRLLVLGIQCGFSFFCGPNPRCLTEVSFPGAWRGCVNKSVRKELEVNRVKEQWGSLMRDLSMPEQY